MNILIIPGTKMGYMKQNMSSPYNENVNLTFEREHLEDQIIILFLTRTPECAVWHGLPLQGRRPTAGVLSDRYICPRPLSSLPSVGQKRGETPFLCYPTLPVCPCVGQSVLKCSPYLVLSLICSIRSGFSRSFLFNHQADA